MPCTWVRLGGQPFSLQSHRRGWGRKLLTALGVGDVVNSRSLCLRPWDLASTLSTRSAL